MLASVSVRDILADCGEFRHERMIGRQVAYRVGGPGIAGEQEGLAPAAAEVLLAPGAASARLAHPVGSAKSAKGRRVAPDIRQRMIPDGPKFEAGDRLRCMAWQYAAPRRDVERAPAPAAHAWLGVARVIIGDDRIDHDPAVMPGAQRLDLADGALDLLARRHQGSTVLQRPAIILHVRDLDAAC